MTEEQAKQLEAPFLAEEIKWKPIQTSKDRTKALVNAFVDSRAIQKRLDSVLGRDNWQNDFIYTSGAVYTPKKDKDLAVMSCVCILRIYDAQRNEWISKSDGAGNTDVEPIKGGISDAFKRAASMWGVGRYLYEMPDIWVRLRDGKYIADEEKARLADRYNQFAAQYRSGKAASRGTAPPPDFRKQPQIVPKAPAWKVLNFKVNRRENGVQTRITLLSPDNQSVTGYIRGEAALHTGQMLHDVKMVTKESPAAGKYHIIESYRCAA